MRKGTVKNEIDSRIHVRGRTCMLDYVLRTEVGNRKGLNGHIPISLPLPVDGHITCVHFKKKYLNVIQFGPQPTLIIGQSHKACLRFMIHQINHHTYIT